MLDSDLAELYGVTIDRLNEQVRRNRSVAQMCMAGVTMNVMDWQPLPKQILSKVDSYMTLINPGVWKDAVGGGNKKMRQIRYVPTSVRNSRREQNILYVWERGMECV